MKQKYYIVAANYNEYLAWRSSNRPVELIPEWNDPNYYVELQYVRDTNTIRGLSDIKGFFLPDCEFHPHYQEIKTWIDIIKSKQYNSAKQPTITGYNITGVILDELYE